MLHLHKHCEKMFQSDFSEIRIRAASLLTRTVSRRWLQTRNMVLQKDKNKYKGNMSDYMCYTYPLEVCLIITCPAYFNTLRCGRGRFPNNCHFPTPLYANELTPVALYKLSTSAALHQPPQLLRRLEGKKTFFYFPCSTGKAKFLLILCLSCLF